MNTFFPIWITENATRPISRVLCFEGSICPAYTFSPVAKHKIYTERSREFDDSNLLLHLLSHVMPRGNSKIQLGQGGESDVPTSHQDLRTDFLPSGQP
jgi:hypothetical protein